MELGELLTREAHEAGAECKIKGPDGKLTDLVITVRGVDSKEWRKANKDAQRDALRAAANGKPVDVDEVGLLVSATIGWHGLVNEGKEYKFSEKRCRQLYEDAPYIRDQVDQFVGKRSNFTTS